MKRLASTLSVSSLLVSAVLFVGCSSGSTSKAESTIAVTQVESSDGSASSESVAASDVEAPETVAQAVTSISEQPGQATDGFVGAAKDVKLESCKLDGAAWAANGTVTNSSESDASYRIYVAFNVKGSTDTKAAIQANVDVAKGKTEKWDVTADVADKDLQCILRVERVNK
jgi:hypothetical protein